MKIVIIIPTYFEAENISRLIPEITKVTGKLNQEISILVVDDSSPDGTGEIVKKLARENNNLYLLTGAKKGLGNAYTRGFEFAIEKLKAEVIIQMDADFSHAPSDIPKLILEIEKGFDVIIGSRYVAGGQIADWSFWRRFLSKIANFGCRTLINSKNIKDCTAGFRAIRTDVLKKINFNQLNVNSYSFQVKLLSQLISANAKIKEIPVKFVDRKSGSTKLGVWDIMEGIITLVKLKVSR